MEENFFGIMKSELLYAENFEWSKPLKAWDNYIEYYKPVGGIKLIKDL